MSRVYVHALTHGAFGPLRVGAVRIEAIRGDGVTALIERRAAAPPVSEASLREQHAVVEALWRRTDALLPVRYGAFIDESELLDLLRLRAGAFAEALDLVRGRAQMTLRFGTRAVPQGGVPAAAAGADPGGAAPGVAAASGAEYLEARRRAAAGPSLPPAADGVRAAGAGLAAAERYDGRLAPTVFHLVDEDRVAQYRRRVARAARALPPSAVVVSGPWPAFAFAPDLVV